MSKVFKQTLKSISFSDAQQLHKMIIKPNAVFPKRLLKKVPKTKNPYRFLLKIKQALMDSIYIPSMKKYIKTPSGGGSFASYYKINAKKGIKTIEKEYSTKKKMMSSRTWKHAQIEVRMQKRAKLKYSIIANCYGVVPVKCISGKWKVGILVEHCEGHSLLKSKNLLGKKFFIHNKIIKVRVKKDLAVHIDRIFRANDVFHNDLNLSNVIIQGDKVRVIDFGCATKRPQKMVKRYGSTVFSLIY